MNNKVYYFIAIGGVGQSALAKILSEQGFKVEGSDINESKYTKQLRALGIKINTGHSEDNIKENMTVVISSAIKEDNPELKRAKELNLKILHRSDMLKIISENCAKFIGFSGTHGKTTTSGLCSFLLEKNNINVSYAIGGIIPELNTNAKSGPNYKDSVFVAELDESDGTIIKYSPDILAINNLEEDHLDFYKNGLEEIIQTFKKICDNNLGENSKIIINTDNEGNKKFLKELNKDKKVVTYSIKDKNADYYADNIRYNTTGSSFAIYKKGTYLTNVVLSIPGEHNIYNSLCTLSSLSEAGFDIKNFIDSIKEFSGMGRRFQHVADFNGINVIDDYAHHPTEIKSTLEAAKRTSKGRIVAIFQPHRYTRLKALWEEFKKSFYNADVLAVVDVFKAGDIPSQDYNSENFAKEIKHHNCRYFKGTIEEAGAEIYKILKENDLVLTLGAGDITKMGKILNEEYEKNQNNH